MNAMLSDLKHGLRVLVRTPLFTICTIAALAIGIGSTTALFSVVHAMLLKPLPYADADQLLVIWEHNLPRNRPRNVVNIVNFMGWRDRTKSFDGMAALQQNRVTLTGSGEPMELSTLIVTANMFDVLGASPMIGRDVPDGRRSEHVGAHDGAVARVVGAALRRHGRRPGHARHRERRARAS